MSNDKIKKVKPSLSPTAEMLLKKRNELNHARPLFRRQNWFRYKRLSRSGWRRPRGMHSKQRRHYGYRPPVVSIGYGGPRKVRNIHPSGFREVMVYNSRGLENIDRNVYAIRIAGTVGIKKRIEIVKRANELNIKILNPVVR